MSRDIKVLEKFIKELIEDRKVLEKQKIFKDEYGNRILYKNLDSDEIKALIEANDQIDSLNMLIMEKKAKIDCLKVGKTGVETATIYKDYPSDTVYMQYETESSIIMKEYSAYKEETTEWVVNKANKTEMKELKELISEMPVFFTNKLNLKGVR